LMDFGKPVTGEVVYCFTVTIDRYGLRWLYAQ
jgi:hypothetical protein